MKRTGLILILTLALLLACSSVGSATVTATIDVSADVAETRILAYVDERVEITLDGSDLPNDITAYKYSLSGYWNFPNLTFDETTRASVIAFPANDQQAGKHILNWQVTDGGNNIVSKGKILINILPAWEYEVYSTDPQGNNRKNYSADDPIVIDYEDIIGVTAYHHGSSSGTSAELNIVEIDEPDDGTYTFPNIAEPGGPYTLMIKGYLTADPDTKDAVGVEHEVYLGSNNTNLIIDEDETYDDGEPYNHGATGGVVTIYTTDTEEILADGRFAGDDNSGIVFIEYLNPHQAYVTVEAENEYNIVTYFVQLVTSEFGGLYEDSDGDNEFDDEGLLLYYLPLAVGGATDIYFELVDPELDVTGVYAAATVKLSYDGGEETVHLADSVEIVDKFGDNFAYFKLADVPNSARSITVEVDNGTVERQATYTLIRPVLERVVFAGNIEQIEFGADATEKILQLEEGYLDAHNGKVWLKPIAMNGGLVSIAVEDEDNVTPSYRDGYYGVDMDADDIVVLTITVDAGAAGDEEYKLTIVGEEYKSCWITEVKVQGAGETTEFYFSKFDAETKTLYVRLPEEAEDKSAIFYQFTITGDDDAKIKTGNTIHDWAPANSNWVPLAFTKDDDEFYLVDSDGVEYKYNLVFDQAGSGASDIATLESLDIFEDHGWPNWDEVPFDIEANIYDYVIAGYVGADTDLRFWPETTDDGAWVFMDNVFIDQAEGSEALQYNGGTQLFTIKVVAADGVTEQDHKLYVKEGPYGGPLITELTAATDDPDDAEITVGIYNEDRTIYVFIPFGVTVEDIKYGVDFNRTATLFDGGTELISDEEWHLTLGEHRLTLIENEDGFDLPSYYTINLLQAGEHADSDATLDDLELSSNSDISGYFNSNVLTYGVYLDEDADHYLMVWAKSYKNNAIFINGKYTLTGDMELTLDGDEAEGDTLATIKVLARDHETELTYTLVKVDRGYRAAELESFKAYSETDGEGTKYITVIDEEFDRIHVLLPYGVQPNSVHYQATLAGADATLGEIHYPLPLEGDQKDVWVQGAFLAGDDDENVLTVLNAQGLPSQYDVYVQVCQNEKASNNAKLWDEAHSGLSLYSGNDDPVSNVVKLDFDPDVLGYAVKLADAQEWLEVWADAQAEGALIFINNFIYYGNYGFEVDIQNKEAPELLAEIFVVAPDYKTTRTYRVRLGGDYVPAELIDFKVNSRCVYDDDLEGYVAEGAACIAEVDNANRKVQILLPKGTDLAEVGYGGFVSGDGGELYYPGRETAEQGKWVKGALKEGDNPLTVTDSDGLATVYTANVLIADSTDDKCGLDDIRLFTSKEAGLQTKKLDFDFDPDLRNFTLEIPEDAEYATVAVSPTDKTKHVFINNEYSADCIKKDIRIPDGVGQALCWVKVVAADGVTSKEYAIYVKDDDYEEVVIDSFRAVSELEEDEDEDGNMILVPEGDADEYLTVVDEVKRTLYIYLPYETKLEEVGYCIELSDGEVKVDYPYDWSRSGEWGYFDLGEGDIVTVKDKYGIPREYTVTIKTAAKNADDSSALDALEMFTGAKKDKQEEELELDFDPEITSYIVVADEDHGFVTVEAEAEDEDALIFINNKYYDKGEVEIENLERELDDKAAVFEIKVLAADASNFTTYTVALVDEDYEPVSIASFQANSKDDAEGTAYITAIDAKNKVLSVFLPSGVRASTVRYCLTLSDGKAKVFLNDEDDDFGDIEGKWGKYGLDEDSVFTIRDRDGVSTDYSVKLYEIKSGDNGVGADLSGLAVYSGEAADKQEAALKLNFSMDTTTYAVSSAEGAKFVKIAATPADANAYVLINGALAEKGLAEGLKLDADEGRTVYEIMVVSQDGKNSKVYTLTVNRGQGVLGGASIAGLVMGQALSPAFSPDIFNYVAYTATGTSNISVTANALDEKDMVDISCISGGSGGSSSPGTASAYINLALGINVIRISVYDGEANTLANYYISVYRPHPTNKVMVSSHKIFVNGVYRGQINAYNINNNNFLQLRDIAVLLAGTNKEFSVGVDAYNMTATLHRNGAYIRSGTENAANSEEYSFNGISLWSFTIDGGYVYPIAYNISDSNFVMLRDMAALLDFAVSFDAGSDTIYINTHSPYTPGQ